MYVSSPQSYDFDDLYFMGIKGWFMGEKYIV